MPRAVVRCADCPGGWTPLTRDERRELEELRALVRQLRDCPDPRCFLCAQCVSLLYAHFGIRV